MQLASQAISIALSLLGGGQAPELTRLKPNVHLIVAPVIEECIGIELPDITHGVAVESIQKLVGGRDLSVIQNGTYAFLIPKALTDKRGKSQLERFLRHIESSARAGKSISISELPAETRSIVARGLVSGPWGSQFTNEILMGNARLEFAGVHLVEVAGQGKSFTVSEPSTLPRSGTDGDSEEPAGLQPADSASSKPLLDVQKELFADKLEFKFSTNVKSRTRLLVASEYLNSYFKMREEVLKDLRNLTNDYALSWFGDISEKGLRDSKVAQVSDLSAALQQKIKRRSQLGEFQSLSDADRQRLLQSSKAMRTSSQIQIFLKRGSSSYGVSLHQLFAP